MICYRAKHPKNQENHKDRAKHDHHFSENGSVIVWILIGVVLFAALSFTFSQGFRGGEASLSKERAELAAQEMIQYGMEVQSTIQELLINGCEDTQLSFEPVPVPTDTSVATGLWYDNPNSPADESCHIFSQNGGGLRWKNFGHILNTTNSTFIYPLYGARVRLTGGGTNEGEAHIIWHYVPESVCKAFNKKILGIDDYVSFAWFPGVTFTGTYENNQPVGNNATTEIYAGKQGGCYYHNYSGQEGFRAVYYVLIR